MSKSGTLVTFEDRPNGLRKVWGNGRSYEGAFDFKPSPLLPDSGPLTIVLARLGPGSFQELERRGGQIIEQRRFQVSPDGNSMKVMAYDRVRDRIMRYTMTRVTMTRVGSTPRDKAS